MFATSRRSPARPTLPALLVTAAVLLAACSGSASPSPSAAPSVAVGTGAEAMAVVAAHTPWFDGVKPKDPNAVGATAWWEASPMDAGTPPAAWSVVVTVGWGDCQAGCINRHVWTWQVTTAGSLTAASDSGPAVPADQTAALAAAATSPGIGGRASAGPVCPVVRPGQTGCDPRSVKGAVLVIKDASGKEVARATTDDSGFFRVAVAPGAYTVEAQPVQGLMGTAPVVSVTVEAGHLANVSVDYDTGIR
jgi:hypothetical protein